MVSINLIKECYMLDSRSHKFEEPKELLKFITNEIFKYIGIRDSKVILRKYNRLTVEELAMEVYLKLLRSSKEYNKSYIRQAVIYVCIDEYRKNTEVDPLINKYDDKTSENEQKADGNVEYQFPMMDRLLQLKLFDKRELSVIQLMMEGYRNNEIREILKIPKVTYYGIINRIKIKYIDWEEDLEALKVITNKAY